MVLLQTVIKKAFIKVQNIKVRNDIVVRMSVVRSAILVLAGLPLIIMLGVFMLPRNMDTALAQSMDTTEKNTVSQERLREQEILAQYQEYCHRFEAVEQRADIAENGFAVVETQIFPIAIAGYAEDAVSMLPAFDQKYNRMVLFFVESSGKVIYKTDQLETNHCIRGQVKQPKMEIAAIGFQDLDLDGQMDIVLITLCENESGALADKTYKVGDVLFQDHNRLGFYRDYRIADKINRFGMNKSAKLITAFVRDGYSTEFLYTAATLEELQQNNLQVIEEQCYFRTFGKLGRLQVVPGTYRIADYDVFLIYLVNEDGYIVSSIQPMEDYDNFYALNGITCKDIDGDGLKDMVVLAKYSYDGGGGQLTVKSDYNIYYQRTGGFSADTEIKAQYPCSEEDTMETIVTKAREYWGWKIEND